MKTLSGENFLALYRSDEGMRCEINLMTGRNRRWPVAALVLFGHVLVVLLLDRMIREEPLAVSETRRSVLFFLRPYQPSRHIQNETPMLREPSAESNRPSIKPPSFPPVEVQSSPRARSPSFDWRHEASEAAGNAIRAQQAADALKFSLGSKAPKKKCVKPKLPEWRAEGPRSGFSHGLPYLLFHDDRCIFLVIYFGCGFGAKPQADSHLFDNMQNYPNDSSVPDLDECEE